ncbi:MAG: flavodoxin family protein [Desulfarculaceae bacterium]|nr:flavodoxin family protein [Desulfarculaceae bacterium]MCF8123854.1 flavodoxin family protein [Desulfarculaceae bacterium]
MRALIINGSARGAKGVTAKLAGALAEGLVRGGASVDTLFVADMSIAPCTACLSCMHLNPGHCAQRDDMDLVLPLLKQADLLVWAAPVYTDTVSAQTKAVMDRTICSKQPFLYQDAGGRVRHPKNWDMPSKVMVVSTCSFPEPVNFEPLVATIRAQTANFGGRCLAELCVPGSLAIQMEPTVLEPHLALIAQAGLEVAQEGRVRPGTLAAIKRPPFSVDRYWELAGRYEEWCRKKQAKMAGKRDRKS